MGAVVTAAPGLMTAVRWVGAAFLIGYGLLAAKRALRPEVGPNGAGERVFIGDASSATPAAGRARTLAPGPAGRRWPAPARSAAGRHPHRPRFHLAQSARLSDTLVFLGSVATSHGDRKWWFGAGAALASVLWFTALHIRALPRLFARPPPGASSTPSSPLS